MDLDDLEPRAKPVDPFHENLEDMSLEELAERIETLNREIARCEAMIASKNTTRQDAESIFR